MSQDKERRDPAKMPDPIVIIRAMQLIREIAEFGMENPQINMNLLSSINLKKIKRYDVKTQIYSIVEGAIETLRILSTRNLDHFAQLDACLTELCILVNQLEENDDEMRFIFDRFFTIARICPNVFIAEDNRARDFGWKSWMSYSIEEILEISRIMIIKMNVLSRMKDAINLNMSQNLPNNLRDKTSKFEKDLDDKIIFRLASSLPDTAYGISKIIDMEGKHEQK